MAIYELGQDHRFWGFQYCLEVTYFGLVLCKVTLYDCSNLLNHCN